MTIADGLDFLNNLDIYSVDVAEIALFSATENLRADFTERIFTDGEKTDGTKIGTYKNYGHYARKEDFVAQSKFRQTVGKRGKIIASFYTPHGHGGVRAAQGYETGFVNLLYHGDLRLSIETLRIDANRLQLRFNNLGQLKKARENETRYGTIFTVSNSEINDFKEYFKAEYQNRLTNAINGNR